MTKKHLLLSSVSALTMGVLIAPAFAQDAVETVVVTGIRASLQSAQAIKQNSDQVVDSITAVDIGALPDRNVAEALQRVPGVTLQRNDAPNDLTRLGSTGNSVFVRGLSWVQSLVNGRVEFTAVNGRTLSFADISADLMQTVNVYKSPTASMVEGGVGGTVDLLTRKPFDHDGQVIAVSGDMTYGDLADRALPSFNALYSDRWNTGIGEIGYLVSIDWQDQITRTMGVNVNPYDCWNPNDGHHYDVNDTGTGYATCMAIDVAAGRRMGPDGLAWRQMEFKQQRLAMDFVLQWRPTEQWDITLNVLNSYAHFKDVEHYAYFYTDTSDNKSGDSGSSSWGHMATAVFDSNGFYQSSDSTMSSIDTRAGTGHNRNTDVSLNIKYFPNDNWEVTTDLQFVESSSPYRNNTMYTQYLNSFGAAWDVSGGDPAITWTDGGGTRASESNSNYAWLAAMDYLRYNVAHAGVAKFDVAYTAPGNGLFDMFTKVSAGFRFEARQAVSRETNYNWGALGPAWWWGAYTAFARLDGTIGGDGSDLVAANGSTYAGGSSNPALAELGENYAEMFSYQKLFGNDLPKFWVPGENLALMNTIQSYEIMSAIEPAAAGNNQDWARWVSHAASAGCTGLDQTCLRAYSTEGGNANKASQTSSQQQNTYAGYMQVDYDVTSLLDLGLQIDGNFGLRFVRTENQVSAGKLVMPTLNADHCTVGEDLGDGNPIPSCDLWNEAVAWLGGVDGAGETVDRPAVRSGYTDLLPSVNLRIKLTDQIMTRLAFSQSIVRPDFSYTRGNASLSFGWGDSGKVGAVSSSNATGYGGNPYLKPMQADNYDASLEWYFSSSGSLTLSMFYKDISNYFFTSTTAMSFINPNSHQPWVFNYTTYVNGDNGTVKGLELGYTQFYDMLPGALSGIGVQANYTKIFNHGGHNGAVDVTSGTAISNSNNTTLPMEGMSNDSYNIALMYAKYGIDARLAWNWRSRYLSSSNGANINQPVWMDNYGQLDGSLFYDFWDHYKVGMQVTNITGSVFHTDTGYLGLTPRTNWIENDRKFALIFRAHW